MLSSRRAVMTLTLILLAVLIGVGWGTAVAVLSSPAFTSVSATTPPSPTPWEPDVAPTSVLAGPLVPLAPGDTPASPSPRPPAPSATRTPLRPKPTPTHTAPATPSPALVLITYVVQEGDTLSEIAARFGTTVELLRRVNGLADTTIRAGDEVRVPITSDAATLTPTTTSTREPTPTPTRTRTPPPPPTRLPLPSPTPTRELFPPPRLIGPEDGAEVTTPVTLRWEWEGQLGPDEYFDVRLWRPGEPHYGIAWTKTPEYVLDGTAFQGLYFWSVAVVRGKDGTWLADLSQEPPARQLTISVPTQGSSETTTPPKPQPTPTR